MTHHRAGTGHQDDREPPLRDKVAFLGSAGAHDGAGEVELRETRMAWVFLAGDRVFKLKKPVRYPYLDYASLGARRWVCEEEVRLNRRLAPEVYLGVARLTREADGTLAIDGAGEVVDWLVEMVRLPQRHLLDEAIGSDAVGRREIEAVAGLLVGFYRAAAPVRVDPDARLTALRKELEKTREVLAMDRFAALSETGCGIVDALGEVLAASPDLVAARVEADRIVEGHGDLKPEHVCLTDPPVVIDCLEFSRGLRLVDPFDELSYLAMECDMLGARRIGRLLLRRCADALGDHPPEETLAFYRGCCATLRARQSLEHLLEPEPRTPEKWEPRARAYLGEADRALATLRPR